MSSLLKSARAQIVVIGMSSMAEQRKIKFSGVVQSVQPRSNDFWWNIYMRDNQDDV